MDVGSVLAAGSRRQSGNIDRITAVIRPKAYEIEDSDVPVTTQTSGICQS